MSGVAAVQRSAWTPKTYPPDNEKVFQERMALIKKWFAAWNSTQRWTLVEYLLQRISDPHLIHIYNLLAPLMAPLIPPDPPPPQDFTRVLPRVLSLKIFSFLDPLSLCRAAQVCWHWKYLCDTGALWRSKCLRRGWFLPRPPLTDTINSSSPWKTHYINCVSNIHWTLATATVEDETPSPDDTLFLPPSPSSSSPLPPSPTIHHTLSSSSWVKHRTPWRDPNPHPEDLTRHTIYMTSQDKEDYAFMRVSTKMKSGKKPQLQGTHTVSYGQSGTTPEPLTQWSPPAHTTTTPHPSSTTLTHLRSSTPNPTTSQTMPHQSRTAPGPIHTTADQTMPHKSSTIPEPLPIKLSPTHSPIRTTADRTTPRQSSTTPESLPTKRPPTPNHMCATVDQTMPLNPTMHPTLLEKLRLGTPTPEHTQFSVVNNKSRQATRNAIQQASPFPKLPAYFTGGGRCSLSGSKSRTRRGRSQDHVTGHVTQLTVQPWNIPEPVQ